MIQNINITIYPVTDIARAKAHYGKLLGVAPYVDSPYYVGFKVGDYEIGLAGAAKGQTGPITYWQVADVKQTLRAFVEAGATTHQDATDVGGGMLIAMVKDVDGNLIGLRQFPG